MQRVVLCLSFKDPFLLFQGWREVFKPSPSLSLAGLTTLPGLSVFSRGWGGSGRKLMGVPISWSPVCPGGSLHNVCVGVSVCRASHLPPPAWP